MELNIKKIIDGLYFTVGMILFNPATGVSKTPNELNEDDRYTYDACMGAIELLKAKEPPTSASISSSIECLLHPQDADDSDMAKAIDTAVRTMRLLKAQKPIEARLHLCESCTKEYPECDATIDGIEFGCGVGNDNIIGCTAYVNRWKAQEPKPPVVKENSYGWKFYYCASCGKEFYQNNKFSFCEKCGQAVRWE